MKKPYLHITKSVTDATLATPALQGIRLLEPFKSIAIAAGAPLKILGEVNARGDAEVHLKEADLWLCLEGETTFTLGGELQNGRARVSGDGMPFPDELMGDGISGGEEIALTSGEWIHIPTGVPHQHHSSGTTRLVIIKIPK